MTPQPEAINRVVLYARVSTQDKGQDVENQLVQLREFCAKRGWTITHEYIDHVSGKSSSNRPQFQKLFTDAAAGSFDLVFFWALDRFSREGTYPTLCHLQKLDACGVAWKSFTEEYLDSCGMFKDAVIAILATIAKQERLRISERTKAGLRKARANGVRLGPRLRADVDVQKILRLRAEGKSWREIERETGIPKSTCIERCPVNVSQKRMSA
jgi:DNA invertase Pin-like site-specific DNA recombinase